MTSAFLRPGASGSSPAAPSPRDCPRCHGLLLLDTQDRDLGCVNCGWRRVVPWEQEQRTADGKSRRRDPSFMGWRL